MALKTNINDREFDKFEEILGVERVNTSALTFDYPLKYLKDEISSNLYYEGWNKDFDAATSDSTWLIKRYSKSGATTSVDWANDGLFVSVWDDRYSYFGGTPGGYENSFSIDFENKGDHINIGNVAPLSFERTNSFSISVWLRVQNTNERVIFSKQGNSNAAGYRFYAMTNALRFLLSGGSGANRIEVHSAATSINDGNWHHAVVTYNGSSLASGVTFYLDGAALSSGTYTIASDSLSSTIVNTTAAQISGRNGATSTFEGHLNNISVWNKVLSALEVAEIYDTGSPIDCRDHSAAANLVLFTKLYDANDVASFPTCTDLSTNALTGTGITLTKDQINIDVP